MRMQQRLACGCGLQLAEFSPLRCGRASVLPPASLGDERSAYAPGERGCVRQMEEGSGLPGGATEPRDSTSSGGGAADGGDRPEGRRAPATTSGGGRRPVPSSRGPGGRGGIFDIFPSRGCRRGVRHRPFGGCGSSFCSMAPSTPRLPRAGWSRVVGEARTPRPSPSALVVPSHGRAPHGARLAHLRLCDKAAGPPRRRGRWGRVGSARPRGASEPPLTRGAPAQERSPGQRTAAPPPPPRLARLPPRPPPQPWSSRRLLRPHLHRPYSRALPARASLPAAAAPHSGDGGLGRGCGERRAGAGF